MLMRLLIRTVLIPPGWEITRNHQKSTVFCFSCFFARNWATTRRLPAKQVSLTLFDGVQAGYHTKEATKASKTVSARSPSHHGCEQH
jgi:hypothetical protein